MAAITEELRSGQEVGRRSRRSTRLSLETCTVAKYLLLFSMGFLIAQNQFIPDANANPLVIPNRFSFQKTTTTSSTPVPSYDHDHSLNSSIPPILFSHRHRQSNSRSNYPPPPAEPTVKNAGFRYDIAVWLAVGLICGICFLILKFWPKAYYASSISSDEGEGRSDGNDDDDGDHPQANANYIFPPNMNHNDLKTSSNDKIINI